jgi:hypothetical protein
VSEGQPSFGQGGCRSVAGVQAGVEDTDRIIETVPVADGNERLTAADSAGARRGRRGQRRQAAPQTVAVELRRIAVRARGRCFLELPRGAVKGRWHADEPPVGRCARCAQILTIEPVTKLAPPEDSGCSGTAGMGRLRQDSPLRKEAIN